AVSARVRGVWEIATSGEERPHGMNRNSSRTRGRSEVTPEPSEQRLLARVREERDRRIIDYAAQMLATLCRPLRGRNGRGRGGPAGDSRRSGGVRLTTQ